MKRKAWLWALILVTCGFANGPGLDLLWAQTGQTEAERRQQEIDRIKAETELTKERTALEAATATRLKGLIPSFEGKATVEQGGGQLEASMLASQAVNEAARRVAARLTRLTRMEAVDRPANRVRLAGAASLCEPVSAPVADARAAPRFVILAGAEEFDLGIVDYVRGQIAVLCTNLANELPDRTSGSGRLPYVRMMNTEGIESVSGIALPIQIASAVFGALRSDVTITPATTSGITDRLFSIAVSARLPGQAVLGSAPTISRPPVAGETYGIERQVHVLIALRWTAIRYRDQELQGDANKEKRERISALINRLDAFLVAITTADSKGSLPLARAVRLERLAGGSAGHGRPYIVRVYADHSGGSMINTRNITTFVGADPLRVSGGLIASFVATDAESGVVSSAGVFTCRTALVRLRRVQDGTWQQNGRDPVCYPLPDSEEAAVLGVVR